MDQVNRLLLALVQNGNTPSVQYAHFTPAKLLYSFCAGQADIANQIPVSERHSINAFSITKTFTALAILQLEEAGALRLHDPVKKHLTDFPYNDKITIYHLLTHSSGIPNPLPLSWIHTPDEHPQFNAREFFHPIFKKHGHLKFEPGQKFAYTNLGYVLLGQVIEGITSLPYEHYITANIISRLQLSPGQLGFTIHPLQHAKGYQKQYSFLNAVLGLLLNKSKYMGAAEKGWKPFVPNYVNGSAYGGLITTIAGLTAYLQQLLQHGGTLLQPETCAQLFVENKTANGKPTGMCLGWFTAKQDGIPYYTHAGGGGGYYCEILLYPTLNKGSVLLLNRTGISDARMLSKFDGLLL